MMVTVSCSGKFHAFALAEQLSRHGHLKGLYTTYAYQKNKLFRKLAGRIDKEDIAPGVIHTNIPIAIAMKVMPKDFVWNDLFDKWVASQHTGNATVFIGWSGMCLRSIRAARKKNIVTIVERGSSHILYQNNILKEEYSRMGKNFSIDNRVIEKELREYEEADYISIPSAFVRNSFLLQGVSEKKLVQNPYGVSNFFRVSSPTEKKGKFTVLYLGMLSIRKGLVYLFEALRRLSIPESLYEVHFIGAIHPEISEVLATYRQQNWKLFGHIPFYDLPSYLQHCDVAVQPSLEEGLSMVIPQLMACGIPVIASSNTGGEDIIKDNVTGYIVPVRSPAAIAEKINFLFHHPERLAEMKQHAREDVTGNYSWDKYGERYTTFLRSLNAGAGKE